MNWFSFITKITYSIDLNSYYTSLAMECFEHDLAYVCRTRWVKGYTSEDLAQELRLQLWNKLPLYDPSKGSLRTWAKRVMVNRVRNLRRDSKRYKRTIQYHTEPLLDKKDEPLDG